jgi:Cu(I)/Ag(I) efflux system membrane fusion protein
VTATVTAYPGATFTGKVAFVYPSVSPETRTAKVRIEVPNPDGRLKTDMSANVELAAGAGNGSMVAVPDSAVLNSGTRQVVLVDRGEGRFEPREVSLGASADGYTEIRSGVTAGEPVVVGANFLIDAEANLRAALRSFTPPPAEGAKP